MKEFQIAIAYRESGFSDRWVEYCKEKGISYKIVDCYKSDIISQLASADALLWHWDHERPEDALIARSVIYAAELMGLKVFPDTVTCWSFDNKLAQKYILEAVGVPFVPTYVFLDRQTAMDWVEQASFPKVFKLSKGAGSKNVRLVHSAREGRALVEQAFGRGFRPLRHAGDVMGKFVKGSRQQRIALLKKIKRAPQRLLEVHRINKQMGRERGYVYFQDFVPDNQFDTRITVLGGRYAFGFTRGVRKNDFRASGSGSIDYNREKINPNCIKISFDTAKKLGVQSMAFDFVTDIKGNPWITEMSYAYVVSAVYDCTGYWDDRLQWHQGHIWPPDLVLSDIIEQVRQTKEDANKRDNGKDNNDT